MGRKFNVRFLGRNIAPLHFKTEKVVETALRAFLFGTTLAQFAGPWGIFSSSGDFTLLPDGLSFQ